MSEQFVCPRDDKVNTCTECDDVAFNAVRNVVKDDLTPDKRRSVTDSVMREVRVVIGSEIPTKAVTRGEVTCEERHRLVESEARMLALDFIDLDLF